MDGCSGFPPDSQTASIKQYSVGLRAVTVRAISRSRGIRPAQMVTAKNCSNPKNRVAAAVFPQQKITGSVLADPCALPRLSSSPDLRVTGFCTAFSGFPNDRLSSVCISFALTVAVPSGNLTRLSILLRGCYRDRRHSNGIFTCRLSIYERGGNVNRKRKKTKRRNEKDPSGLLFRRRGG